MIKYTVNTTRWLQNEEHLIQLLNAIEELKIYPKGVLEDLYKGHNGVWISYDETGSKVVTEIIVDRNG